MEDALEFEKPAAKKNAWLMTLLHNSALNYSYADGNITKLMVVRNKFISVLSEELLKRVQKEPTLVEYLNTKIYEGVLGTVLAQFTNALYRRYIEEKDETSDMVIIKKHMNKLQDSPAEFIRKARLLAPLVADFITIEPSFSGDRITLELSLIF